MRFSKPSQQVMQAFASLRSNRNFLTILSYLEDCKRQSDDEHRDVEDVNALFRNNGGAKVVEELMRLYHLSGRM
jgi:hypothetical protein